MANSEQFAILMHGIDTWNSWRKSNPQIKPDLREVDLSETNLSGADLHEADFCDARLCGANLSSTDFSEANCTGAKLSYAKLVEATLCGTRLIRTDLSRTEFNGADLSTANLMYANLKYADLSRANCSAAKLCDANLSDAKLSGTRFCNANLAKANLSYAKLTGADLGKANCASANFCNADLSKANLNEANLTGADLSDADFTDAKMSGACLTHAKMLRSKLENTVLKNCNIHEIFAWEVGFTRDTDQSNLIITPEQEPAISVDNILVAQFFQLLLNSAEIREVLRPERKAVLVLGTVYQNKEFLDSIADELRTRNFFSIVLDLERASDKRFKETVHILAELCRFIVADLSDPSSVSREILALFYRERIPFVPLVQEHQKANVSCDDFKNEPGYIPPVLFSNTEEIENKFDDLVIKQAEEKLKQMLAEKIT